MLISFGIMELGCGGGSGDSGSYMQNDDSSGWDTRDHLSPNNQNTNTNTNNNTGNQNTNNNTGNQNTNNNTGQDSPATISGTWEIVSGRGISSNDIAGRLQVLHLTYAPGKNGPVGIELTQNTEDYHPYKGLYSMTLTGDNVIGSGVKGAGALSVYFTIDEYPNEEARPIGIFASSPAFEYVGNGTYHTTNDIVERPTGMVNNVGEYEYTLRLENASSLRWTVWSKTNALTTGSTGEGFDEIVLRKVQ